MALLGTVYDSDINRVTLSELDRTFTKHEEGYAILNMCFACSDAHLHNTRLSGSRVFLFWGSANSLIN